MKASLILVAFVVFISLSTQSVNAICESGCRTFTKEEIAEGFQENRQNLSATLLRESLEMGLHESDPELFNEIARGAAEAHGIIPNSSNQGP